MKAYNTLSRKKEVFKPKEGKKVELFVCGPTTYDFSHIGHARTYIVFDMLVKYLKEKGYNVFYLQNITDVDDKIVNRAKEENVSWKVLTRKFEREYFKDMKSLAVNSITKYARATSHIKEIISQVERLSRKGFAYKIEDGIYYDISKFKEYGKLSRRTALQAEDAVTRIDESIGKRNRGDFCLWKFSPKESLRLPTGQAKPFTEPSWPSQWGDGRPGWHIEDTAITEKYFGPQYDVHGGAKDLIFPHHEAEISQMEAISGKKPLVRYWFHTGFLTVGGTKMAKSLGNFVTIREFLKKYPTRILRLFVIKAHYRSPIDYTENSILQAEKELERIDEFISKLKTSASAKATEDKQNSKIVKNLVLVTRKEFEKAMDDDFNTPKAIASLFNLINRGNSLIAQNKMFPSAAEDILNFLGKMDKFFNFIFFKKIKEKIPDEVMKLVKEREEERKKGNFEKADEVRKKINNLGYQIEDAKEGPKIKKISNF